jgi:hypothetical protein
MSISSASRERSTSPFQERGDDAECLTPDTGIGLAQPGLGRLMLTLKLVVRGFAHRRALDHIGAILIVRRGGRRRLAGTERGFEVEIFGRKSTWMFASAPDRKGTSLRAKLDPMI